MSFAERLKELRQRSGLTQQKLAAAAGVQREAIARLESGTREPTWAAVQAIAKALGVDCTAFAHDESGERPRRRRPRELKPDETPRPTRRKRSGGNPFEQ
jgi:transcriptional regulator with XRE-family HTH domain